MKNEPVLPIEKSKKVDIKQSKEVLKEKDLSKTKKLQSDLSIPQLGKFKNDDIEIIKNNCFLVIFLTTVISLRIGSL